MITTSRRAVLAGTIGATTAAVLPVDAYAAIPAGPNEDIPPIVKGNIARIGSTEYPTMQAVHDAASPGATIIILPGRHQGSKCVLASTKPLTIIGMIDDQNRRPFFDASGVSLSNGILTPNADLTVEKLGFMNADNGNNAAGIWTNSGLNNLILRWCMFTKNNNGILTSIANPNAVQLYEDCIWHDNGYGNIGRTHNCYVGGGALCAVRRGASRLNNSGAAFKCRARQLFMENFMIVQGSTGNYAVDFSNGGILHISHCSISKPPTNANATLIAVNGEGTINLPKNDLPRTHSGLIEDSVLNNRRTPGIVVNNSFNPQTHIIVRNCQMPGSTATRGPVIVQ